MLLFHYLQIRVSFLVFPLLIICGTTFIKGDWLVLSDQGVVVCFFLCLISLTSILLIYKSSIVAFLSLVGQIVIGYFYYIWKYTESLIFFELGNYNIYFIDRFSKKKIDITDYAIQKLGDRAYLVDTELTTDNILNKNYDYFYSLIDSLIIIEEKIAVPTFFEQYKFYIYTAVAVSSIIVCAIFYIFVPLSVVSAAAEESLALLDGELTGTVDENVLFIFFKTLRELHLPVAHLALLVDCQLTEGVLSSTLRQYSVVDFYTKEHVRVYLEYLIRCLLALDYIIKNPAILSAFQNNIEYFALRTVSKDSADLINTFSFNLDAVRETSQIIKQYIINKLS